MRELLAKEQFRLDRLALGMAPLVQKKMDGEKHRIEQLALRAKSLDPNVLLARGYSITLVNGRIVRDPDALQVGDVVETRVEKGSFLSTVKETHTQQPS